MPENTDYAQLAAYRAYLTTCCQDTAARGRVAARLQDKFDIQAIFPRPGGWRVIVRWDRYHEQATLFKWCRQRGYLLLGTGTDERGNYIDIRELQDV